MPQYGAIDLLYYAYQNHLNSRRLQRFLSLLQKQDEVMIRFKEEIENLSKGLELDGIKGEFTKPHILKA